METTHESRQAMIKWLNWQMEMGVTEFFGETPGVRKRSAPVRQSLAVHSDASDLVPAAPAHLPSDDLSPPASRARSLAGQCQSLREIEAVLQEFDGCGLKETATRLCVSDGNPTAPIMLIGEAPGAEEDRQGKPFVGPSGRLLDLMMGFVGLNRSNVYITNVIYWRPPGNRAPTADEIAICQPFLERQIALIKPKIIVFVGGIAAKALLQKKEGVTRLRGHWYEYALCDDGLNVPATVTFHPAYLLRQPLQKKHVWRDLLSIRAKIDYLGIDLTGERFQTAGSA